MPSTEKTTNFELSQWAANEYLKRIDINEDHAAIDAALGNTAKFETAGGTATAITLTGITLSDGHSKTFVVASDNSAAATTINEKPLYKPGGTTAPKLIAGKAVTVWYDAAGDCFFIKASAEGDAGAGDVLAGKTFSNDDDTGVVGTMPNRDPMGGNSPTASGFHLHGDTYSESNGNNTFMLVPQGYYNGNTWVGVNEPNLKADNVKSGVVIGPDVQIVGTFTNDAVLVPEMLVQGYSGYDDGVKKDGTMINRSAENHHQPAVASTTSDANGYGAYIQPPAGYYTGDSWVRSLQPDLVSANILSGKSIFGVAGSVIAGRRSASGTVAKESLGSSEMFDFADSSTSYLYFSRLIVDGLTFTPSFILIFSISSSNRETVTVYDTISSFYYNPTFKVTSYNGSSVDSGSYIYNLKANTGPAYVNSTGFCAPVMASGTTTWIAIE